MTGARTRTVTVGRVGRAHGLGGAFVLRDQRGDLEVGAHVTIAGRSYEVIARAGSAERPLLRLSGVADRDAARALTGEWIEVERADEELGENEWRVEDLIGCQVEGIGEVVGVGGGPSCDVLELAGGELVPLVGDAIEEIDVQRKSITVDLDFLGLADRGGA